MDAIHKIQEEILQLLLLQHGASSNGTRFTDAANMGSPILIRTASDKKYKNSLADLTIANKDLKANGIFLESFDNEAIKAHLTATGFVREVKVNTAYTEITAKLNKSSTMSFVINEILSKPMRKLNNSKESRTALIFPHICRNQEINNEEKFCFLRLLAVSTHLKNILETCSEKCFILVDQRQRKYYETCHELFPNVLQEIDDSQLPEINDPIEKLFVECAKLSAYKKNTGSDGCSVELDFEKYFESNDVKRGKDGFDKNLKSSIIVNANGEVSNCIKSASAIEAVVNKAISSPEEKFSLINVSTTQQSWDAQKACLCWRMLSNWSSTIDSMALCCCGPCSPNYTKGNGGGMESMDFDNYVRMKSMEILRSYSTRYGSIVQGENWKSIISDVSAACIKFDFLSPPLRNRVELNLTMDESEATSSRGSIFVLYNFSRLATLLNKYEDDVRQGKYPPLPSISEVDFSLLREEQEWRIFVKYVLSYPIVIEDLGSILSRSAFIIDPPTNKVTSFLSSLSRDLSSYYHQTKVLLDPMPHLYPLMFARIYFIKALKQIMLHAFKLISINPPSQM